MRRRSFALLVLTLVPTLCIRAAEEARPEPDPIGTWRGELDSGEDGAKKPLKVTLRIRRDKGGPLTALIDGLPALTGAVSVQNLILVEDVLSFQVPQAKGRYAGSFYGDSLRGTWSEGDASRPLIFHRD